jgi:hypothetical protein
MSENYPYYKPQIGLTEATRGLNEAMSVYFGKHGPCPDDVQTAMLLTPRALTGHEREEVFNQLHLLTSLAYHYHLELAQQEQLQFSLQEARRTLLLGDIFLEGIDYTQDRIDHAEAEEH